MFKLFLITKKIKPKAARNTKKSAIKRLVIKEKIKKKMQKNFIL
jgi:hypothetical protein